MTMSHSRERDRLTEITELTAQWAAAQPLRLCVLFGSQVAGRPRLDSDVDIAAWPLEPTPTAERLRWIHELEILLERPVSLVIAGPDLDPTLGFEIVRNGRLVFEREAGLWQKTRLQLWHAYNDALPFRRALRQSVRRFARSIDYGP